MLAALLMLAVVAERPQVIATFNITASNPDAMLAEQIEKPANLSSEEFASKLVEAEGLTSWSPQDATSSRPGEILQYRARHAANGREVVVYFSPTVGSVCRIRRERGGLSDIHQKAIRWCATSLGISLPAARAPAGTN